MAPPPERAQEVPALRVAIADDHPLWVRALASLLEGAAELSVVATCQSAADVLEQCIDGVDLLLLDFQMPPGDALDVLEQLRVRGATARVVVLSAFTEGHMVRAVVAAGASGYLSKTEPLDDLPELLLRVADGGTAFSEAASRTLQEEPPVLSGREQQVLDLAAGGLTDEAIARRLGVSRHTIRTYLTRVFTKLGAANRAEAVALAARGDGRSPPARD